MRCVFESNVVAAAMRSPTGASAALVRALRRGEVTLVASVALSLDYEGACSVAQTRMAAGLKVEQAGIFVDGLIALIEPVETLMTWAPRLRGAGNELVLEAAVNGHAVAIVTCEKRDYGPIPARYGIEVVSPAEVLRRLGP